MQSTRQTLVQRGVSLFFAAFFTVSMLTGIDLLSKNAEPSPQWAQAVSGTRA